MSMIPIVSIESQFSASHLTCPNIYPLRSPALPHNQLVGHYSAFRPCIFENHSPLSPSIVGGPGFRSATPFLGRMARCRIFRSGMPWYSLKTRSILEPAACARSGFQVFCWVVPSPRRRHEVLLVLPTPFLRSTSQLDCLARHVSAINWVIYVTANHSKVSLS